MMRALEFITGHVIFKLRYDQIYEMKTTHIFLWIQVEREIVRWSSLVVIHCC